MKKNLISVGYQIPALDDLCHEYNSDQSLLDADLIVFAPDTYDTTFGEKPSLDEDESLQIQQDSEHWRRELTTALEYGKTVFVIFQKYQTVSIRTGRKEFKGSKTINYVTDYSNYQFLPMTLPSITAKSGRELVFTGDSTFATYHKEFKKYLRFESYLDAKVARPLFVTRTGERPVGAVFKVGKGHFVLLPVMAYDEDEFVKEANGKEYWTAEAQQFGKRLAEVLFEIDRILRSESAGTPPPIWVKGLEFASLRQEGLAKAIGQLLEKRQLIDVEHASLLADLKKEEQLKNLLFETGKPLEAAVITALHTLGYSAENYHDGELELDQIILSPEGDRFIGECEGKDNSAVNIDKFRQLAENIQSDFQREEVEKPAVGILFGNGFRLIPPKDRQEQFTKKCLTSAQPATILVRTMDLYRVVCHIQESGDESYQKACRLAIASSVGRIVEFPPPPVGFRLATSAL